MHVPWKESLAMKSCSVTVATWPFIRSAMVYLVMFQKDSGSVDRASMSLGTIGP